MVASGASHSLTIEHCVIECRHSFDEVHQSILTNVSELTPELWDILVKADTAKIEAARRDWPKLWLSLVRNHGELTAADGLRSKAMQYEIGNPLTAERMTRHVLAAGLYAPLRIILYEYPQGRVFFEYDLPSSFFGQFGDDRVTPVGRELDDEIASVLEQAGGLQ